MIQPEDKATLPLALDERQPRKRGRPAKAGAMTNAERQRAYRKGRPLAGENGERRLNTYVTTSAALALASLAKRQGLSKREMLERLIATADDEIVNSLDSDTDGWAEYFDVTP